VSDETSLRSQRDAFKCMAYRGAGTLFRVGGRRLRTIMHYPIHTVKTRMCHARNKLRALVPVLAAPRVEALTTRETASTPGFLLLRLPCGTLTLSRLVIAAVVTNLTFIPRQRSSEDWE